MKTLQRSILALMFPLLLLLGFFVPAPAYALNAKEEACAGLSSTLGQSCGASSNSRVTTILKVVLNALSLIAGVAAVVMLMIGGFRYTISQGDGSGTAGAKNTILYALIGAVIVVFAQIIVRFVLGKSV
jgi:hypothetical protein